MKKPQITCLQSRLRQTRTRAARRCQQQAEEQTRDKKDKLTLSFLPPSRG